MQAELEATTKQLGQVRRELAGSRAAVEQATSSAQEWQDKVTTLQEELADARDTVLMLQAEHTQNEAAAKKTTAKAAADHIKL